jgi:hypothetical protein
MTVDTTESPVTITNLENNVNYTLSIVAMNVAYSGSPATISVTPHAPLPPEPPELMTPLRRPNQAFEWVHQFAVAPTAPGQTCVEGQHAWDDTYLYVCVSGGRWVYFQPNKLW